MKVCIIVRPGEQPTPEQILDFCVDKMARHAVPRYVEFVDELPKTATERNQYATLKARGLTPATWDREQAGYQLERAGEDERRTDVEIIGGRR